ncbi:sodium/hydrogen exchanger 9B1-like [Uloborus diversus]|uniref:sodium/hydrogen exchanger 9B1-like n=1 Tax=Uloborus diversus TaxID=327109 RepID=UPI002409E577|nr:sodium/hydrogen exchanger 9B1-like [Uloborus diversus]
MVPYAEISVVTTVKDDSIIFNRGKKVCTRLLPSKQSILLAATHTVVLLFFAGALYGIIGENSLPGSEIFALFSLAISAYAGGVLVGYFKLPPLLGMLVSGILFRNLPFMTFHENISIMWASTFRDTSLVIILLKAGLGLDPEKLKRLKMAVIKLSFIPCLLETLGSSVFAHYLLGLPWLWSCMLGFIVSAVSAAVLVPGVLMLEEKRYGIRSGIPTLIMASVSIDNIVALTGFVVTFSILSSNENLTWALVKRPLEPCIGFLFGGIFGALLRYIPDENIPKNSLVYYRTILLFLGGMAFSFVSKRAGISGAGALSCVSLAFVAALKWRKDPEQYKTICWITGILWQLIEPFLFGLIGAEITLESLQNDLGYAVLTLILGLLVRAIATILALMRSQLSFKEKLFVSSSWLAKATVQAAVGSQALDYARSQSKGYEFETYSKQVLTLSVLSIILTAPLGSAFMECLGPYLLEKDPVVTDLQSESEEDETDIVVEKRASYGSCSVTLSSRNS